MKTTLFLLLLLLVSKAGFAQPIWTICNTPVLDNRVDDIFMVNGQTGYAVCGDGQILKTTDWGNNWLRLLQDTSVYCRSVKFINEQNGFVGGFPSTYSTDKNILRRTNDGGATWTDLSSLIAPRARQGICGLAIADSNTIYGCGNWYNDSAYIVKSTDGGDNWSYIDMSNYAASLIDMYFINKDTGFATGRSVLPLQSAIILYTTNGGVNWTTKFQDTVTYEYCWKIYHLTNQIYFASIENHQTANNLRILKSIDGGMHWSLSIVFTSLPNWLQGIGFIDSLKGWTGGGSQPIGGGGVTFQTNDGGVTWDTVRVCPFMNRFFKINDSLLFATGAQIWRYGAITTGINPISTPNTHIASLICFPNPTNGQLKIDVSLSRHTHALLSLLDERGNRIKVIDNMDKSKGLYNYELNTKELASGTYTILLMTHEDTQVNKIIVTH